MTENKKYTIDFWPYEVLVHFDKGQVTVGDMKQFLASIPDDFILNGTDTYLGALSFSKKKHEGI